MSYIEAHNKYLELKNYLLNTNPGYEAIYPSYKEYLEENGRSHQDNINRFKRALTYFKDPKAAIGSGKKPDIKTYIRKSNKNVNPPPQPPKKDNDNSKTDFLNIKMSNDFTMTGDIQHDFGSTPKLSDLATWKDKDWVAKHNEQMKALRGITGQKFGITHNPKYMSEDYFNWVMKPKPAYEGWQFKMDEDLDDDGVNDAVIYDKDNNMRYFNGYGITDTRPGTMAQARQQYYVDPKNKGNFDNEGFLTEYRKTHPQKAPKIYDYVIKAFAKNLYNNIKRLIQDKQTLKVFTNMNFKGRIESLLYRYCVLPFALIVKGYKENAFEGAIFADPHVKGTNNDPNYKLLLKLYQDRHKLLKQIINNKITSQMLAQVLTVVIIEFNKLIKSNVGEFLKLINGADPNALGKTIYQIYQQVYTNVTGNFSNVDVESILNAITANKI